MNRPSYLTDEAIATFIQSALREDIGEGDHSARGAIPACHQGAATLFTKESGIAAGVELAERIFHQYDSTLSVAVKKKDGQKILTGDTVLCIEGNARSILSAERLVLNCLQRMSGIATYTRKLCTLIAGTGTRVLDTRKTTPNFRLMEKWAVHIGGGNNHRFSLGDSIILKDNHIDMAGDIERAIAGTKKYVQSIKKTKIEVEVRSIEEVKEIMRIGGVDTIMLDNMSLAQMKEAVQLIGNKIAIEASGGITESNIREVAMCGVNYVSVGKITHSVMSLDMSLKAVKKPFNNIHREQHA